MFKFKVPEAVPEDGGVVGDDYAAASEAASHVQTAPGGVGGAVVSGHRQYVLGSHIRQQRKRDC